MCKHYCLLINIDIMTIKVLLVFGTRPEAIKMAPLVKYLQSKQQFFETLVCVTGQHRQMLDQVTSLFQISPDYDLNIMKPGQDLYDVTARILTGMRDVLDDCRPDIVLVHGDTSTSTAAAISAFYKQIPVGHVEAGLRTGDIYSPWPEEMNRQITGRIASLHFAPTSLSRDNLIKENITSNNIVVTGNTVIDALNMVLSKINTDKELTNRLKKELADAGYDTSRLDNGRKMVLITGHRRENFGDGFRNICLALKDLAEKYPEVDFVYPMHLNPNVRRPINEIFAGAPHSNMFFIEPLDYLPFVYMMQLSYMIITDSGGIQEEAPSLGKPVVVMREVTERPEALAAGTIRLVGTNRDLIVSQVSQYIDDKECYDKHKKISNPYGDGNACMRIADFILKKIGN